MNLKPLMETKINLSERHFKLYKYLVLNDGKKINQRIISKNINMPYNTVRNILKKLRTLNLIEAQRQSGNRFTTFTVNKNIIVKQRDHIPNDLRREKGNSLEDAIMEKFSNKKNFPHLKKLGFKPDLIETLIKAWKGRGLLNEFPQALSLSEYAIEAGVLDKNGKPYTYQSIFSTLWQKEMPCQNKKNMGSLPLAKKLDLSLLEGKLLDFIIQLGAMPFTMDLVSETIDETPEKLSSILETFQNDGLINISTDLDATFLSITIACNLVFDGNEYVVFSADGKN